MHTYYIRFNEVLKYIHFHMDEKLDLDKLASIAFVSKYHFHRMIKAYLGESLGTYVNRIRVESGAKLLKYSDDSIAEIAFKIGYQTPTSFNKSFKKQFGVSPSYYRKNSNHSFDIVKKKKEKTSFELTVEHIHAKVILILTSQTKGMLTLEEKKLVWAELVEYATKEGLLNARTQLFGINWDDPSITNKEHFRYDACISIEKEISSARFPVKQIEGGNYLRFTFKGDYKYLGDVYDQIFHDYIIKDNIKLREVPLFEQYLNYYPDTQPKDLVANIFVPIK